MTSTVADRTPATLRMIASPSSLDAEGGCESEVTVWVLDSCGQTVPDGTTVEFSAQSGDGTINPASVQTSGGRVTTTYRAGTVGGSAIIEASAVDSAGTTIA